jgi:hypothetical protein
MGIVFALFLGAAPVTAAETVQRPVVVAGILGSKLCTGTGEVVWGSGNSLKNLARLELNGDVHETRRAQERAPQDEVGDKVTVVFARKI